MNRHWFDSLTAAISVGHSRRALGGLLGATVASALGLDAAAKNKGKKRKRKRKKKIQSPPPPPPPPPPSPPTGPGSCAHVSGNGFTGSVRWAQTFLPPRGGQLTNATIYLRQNTNDFTLNFQIRSVDGFGVPGNTLLASENVSDIQGTVVADPPREVTAVFSPPAAIALGQSYALTITAQIAIFAVHANNSGNPCPDGALFKDSQGFAQFDPVADGGADLVYSVTIV